MKHHIVDARLGCGVKQRTIEGRDQTVRLYKQFCEVTSAEILAALYKKLKRSDLIKKADTKFSIYVRTRGESGGYNSCFTCNRSYEWQYMDAGHFMSRRFLNTRWHPVNVWPQCQECNRRKNGNLVIFEAKLRALFGDEAINELIELAYSTEKVTEIDIREVIYKY